MVEDKIDEVEDVRAVVAPVVGVRERLELVPPLLGEEELLPLRNAAADRPKQQQAGTM